MIGFWCGLFGEYLNVRNLSIDSMFFVFFSTAPNKSQKAQQKEKLEIRYNVSLKAEYVAGKSFLKMISCGSCVLSVYC